MRIRTHGIRMVKASQIKNAPWNWRTHPQDQRQAVAASLEELGFFDPLDVRMTHGDPDVLSDTDEFELFDGHLRKDIIAGVGPDTLVPLNVTDFTEEEAKKANLLKDPLVSMAESNANALAELMSQVDISDGATAKLLLEVQEAAGAIEDDGRSPAENKNGRYPLSPVLNERYEYVVLFSTNETDWAWLQTVLQLTLEQSYKSKSFGIGHVVPISAFRKLWESR